MLVAWGSVFFDYGILSQPVNDQYWHEDTSL